MIALYQVVLLCSQVSEELIRVAILWHEQWHEGLEEASRLYFGDRNVKGMFETLEPLHQMLEKGPQTLKEVSFQHVSLFISFDFYNLLPLLTRCCFTIVQDYLFS